MLWVNSTSKTNKLTEKEIRFVVTRNGWGWGGQIEGRQSKGKKSQL